VGVIDLALWVALPLILLEHHDAAEREGLGMQVLPQYLDPTFVAFASRAKNF